MHDLAKYSRIIAKKLKNERRPSWYHKTHLVRLAIIRPKLRITT